jgi:hypothetical protein
VYNGVGTPSSVYAPQYYAPRQGLGFDLRQANRMVDASELNAKGNNLFYNVPWFILNPETIVSPLPTNYNFAALPIFGNIAKAGAQQMNEDRIQAEIDHYRRTHQEWTREDQDHLDDLVLQRESARNQKMRRFINTMSPAPNGMFFNPFATPIVASTGGPLSAFFERRANENDAELAQNNLHDARQDYREEQNQGNKIEVRNARDNYVQADQRADANTYDLLGTKLNSASRLGPIFRKKASQTKLEIGYRNRRAAQQDFNEDPSEENRDELRLADLFIDATEQEDQANRAEIVFGTFGLTALPIPLTTIFKSVISNNQNFQDEAQIWLRYDKLKRRILIKQKAKEAQQTATNAGASPVEQQMLGMSMYGRAPRMMATGPQ